MDREVLDQTLFPSAARTAAVTNSDKVDVGHLTELLLLLDVTAFAGTTPTLDIRLQVTTKETPAEADWYDLGVAFTQSVGTGKKIIKTNNVGHYVRAVAAIGGTTPSFTFALILTAKS